MSSGARVLTGLQLCPRRASCGVRCMRSTPISAAKVYGSSIMQNDTELACGSASVTEGTANFLVNRRMNKLQQMRRSRRGADLLLQVRCAIYNGALGSGFGNLFEPTSDTVEQLPLAA